QETNREARQTREALEKLMEESRALEAEHKELLFEVKTMRDRQDLLSRDQTSFAEESESVALRLEKLASELDGLSETEKALNQAIEDLTYQKKNQEESKQSLNEELTNLKVSVGRQQEVVSAQSAKVNRLQGEKDNLENEIRETDQAKMRLGEVVQHHSGDRETIREQLEVLRKDKEAVTKWISERRSLRLALYETMQEDEAELKEIKRLHRGITEALRREEVALERLDVELETFLNTLREDYELGYESAKENYPLTLDEADARKQVKLIKRAIEELGNVNIGAIDEFERVSTRLTFLNSQRDDLLEAKQTLLDVIEEMDEEVSKRFEESFRAIRSHFQNVFSELFGGGRADLVLTDPDNYLESGVDILAQPPGKKLQHLSLLSGGERALTAIALLFAILKVRPVPFCVLDEVEAALDDANVDRYADYLTKFSKETQFIVVTHRKGTMEKADVLYGVTMQESGISKLVSVRLEETAELVG
ncbi:MAG TPA: chromosome segregation protein SMC, partial [Sporolactobacillaceae bacterium]|nr:chromosome segregation protein SMC [Sporolactobacillaceae bacterium]